MRLDTRLRGYDGREMAVTILLPANEKNMTDSPKPPIFWNPDGYIELVLHGVMTPDEMRHLEQQGQEIINQHESASILVDARQGRIGRDAASFLAVMKLGRNHRLNRFIIVVDEPTQHPDAGKKTGVIISMLTAALGKRPIYMIDETEARKLARHP
ncbi:MAG: STAS/SEC14 domain-containing protein [Chloroflexi bacterium]|nr:STAS/SEC14 domain-containing protein [Chloroflexota bacterium]